MARMPRAVFERVLHHITQRGNRRQQVFFCDEDYLTYLDLISTYCNQGKVEIWAHCSGTQTNILGRVIIARFKK